MVNLLVNVCFVFNFSIGFCLEMSLKKNYEGYYFMFLFGNVFIGIGVVLLFMLGLMYIEENSKVRSLLFYFGNFNCN